MPFLTSEQSSAASQPAELFQFDTPSVTYRYTSGPVDVVYLGNTFTKLEGLKRSAIAGASSNDPPEFSVEMPYDAPLVIAEAYTMPSRFCTCTVIRVQPGGTDIIWKGSVAAYQIEERVARLRVPSAMDDALASTVPGVAFQFLCPHQLYDTMCTVTEASFQITTTLTGYDGARTYTVAGVGGHADGYYNAGKLKRIADGEPRLIESQLGTTLVVSAPFRTWAVGQSVLLSAGCGHDVFDCRDKFANMANYGGFPGIPNLNPLANLKGLL